MATDEHSGLTQPDTPPPAAAASGTPGTSGEEDVDRVLSSIEEELNALVARAEQTTSRHAEELGQRQADIDRMLQVTIKRQADLDAQRRELGALADEVAAGEHSLRARRAALAERLRRRRRQLAERAQERADRQAALAHAELRTRAAELAEREAELASRRAELASALEAAQADRERAQAEMMQVWESRQLVDDQAQMVTDLAATMERSLSQREQASMELLDKLLEACGLTDRVRELSERLRDANLDARDALEQAEASRRERAEMQCSLDAARARLAQLEARVGQLAQDRLLHEQRAERLRAEMDSREATIERRERQVRAEALRLADDQAACDRIIGQLGEQLALVDQIERQRRLDPRTPLPPCSWPIPVSPRRRPGLRLVT